MTPLGALRRRLDILPARHRSRPLLIGAVVIAVMAVALLSAMLRHVPLTPLSGRVVEAVFHDADNVTGRTVVRVNGVEVGRVQKVQPGPDPYTTSLVVMRITDPSVHLHADASAQVRWRTIFGGLMYIDLHPGSTSRPRLDGPIAASRTSHQVEIDQLLEVYAGHGSQEQRNLLKGLRYTFSNPQGVGATVQTLAPSMRSVQQGLEPLQGTLPGDLRGVVESTAATVAGLDNSAGLQSLVTTANRTLAVTNVQRNQLGQTLSLSPPSLRSTFSTMGDVRTMLGHLDPLVSNLQPGARELGPAAGAARPALRELDTVLREAHPLLVAAGPTFDSLKVASEAGVPLMTSLNPTLTRMLGNILPWLRTRDSSTKLDVYEMVGPFWSDLAAAAEGYDSVGYRIRFTAPLGANSLVMDNPLTATMKSACAHSVLAAKGSDCSRAVSVLAHGWFGQGARR